MYPAGTKYLSLTAAVLATLVSFGLFVSLLLRESASPNAWNMLTILGASASAFAAYYFVRKPIVFFVSYIVFTVSVLPATFGWIAFLYTPSFLLLTVVAMLIVIHPIFGLFNKLLDGDR